jgi:hypothetical protein
VEQIARPHLEGKTICGRTRKKAHDEILVGARWVELDRGYAAYLLGQAHRPACLAGARRAFEDDEAALSQQA